MGHWLAVLFLWAMGSGPLTSAASGPLYGPSPVFYLSAFLLVLSLCGSIFGTGWFLETILLIDHLLAFLPFLYILSLLFKEKIS